MRNAGTFWSKLLFSIRRSCAVLVTAVGCCYGGAGLGLAWVPRVNLDCSPWLQSQHCIYPCSWKTCLQAEIRTTIEKVYRSLTPVALRFAQAGVSVSWDGRRITAPPGVIDEDGIMDLTPYIRKH